jgi:hypothetical protein
MKNRFIAVAALVAALFVALGAGPAAAATPPVNWRHFVGVASGRCLDVDTHSNVTVQLWSCDSGTDESWSLSYVGTLSSGQGFYEIVNRRTGTCLTTAGSASGSALVVGNCTAALTPWWYFPVTTGSVTPFVSVYSGLCVDARNNATGNGTIVQQYFCNGTSAQSWRDA